METRFQTSFIPKKPVTSAIGTMSSPQAPRPKSASLFMTLATIVFVLSIIAAGGSYGLNYYLNQSQTAYKEKLALREKQFNVDLIEDLKIQNVKIDEAKKILNSHIALSQIFEIIGRMTIENVRFTSLDLTVPNGQGASEGIKLALQGYGTSLSAVAYQSDVLSQLDQYNLRKVVRNPVISNPSLNSNGTVSFGFTATIDPSSMLYSKSVNPTASAESTAPAANQQSGTRNPFGN